MIVSTKSSFVKLLVLSVAFTLLTGVAWGSAYTIGYRVHSLNMTLDQFIAQLKG